MPRQARVAPGGLIYHALNRGVGRMTLFEKASDFRDFERCLREAQESVPVRLLCYWLRTIHAPQTRRELGAFRKSIERDQAFGRDRWVARTTLKLGREHSFRPRGRPRKPDPRGGGVTNVPVPFSSSCATTPSSRSGTNSREAPPQMIRRALPRARNGGRKRC